MQHSLIGQWEWEWAYLGEDIATCCCSSYALTFPVTIPTCTFPYKEIISGSPVMSVAYQRGCPLSMEIFSATCNFENESVHKSMSSAHIGQEMVWLWFGCGGISLLYVARTYWWYIRMYLSEFHYKRIHALVCQFAHFKYCHCVILDSLQQA